MKRKVIQLTVREGGPDIQLFAVCDDGSMWHGSRINSRWIWCPVGYVPQDDWEEPR